MHGEDKPQEQGGEDPDLLWGNPKLTLSQHPTNIFKQPVFHFICGLCQICEQVLIWHGQGEKPFKRMRELYVISLRVGSVSS